VLYSDRANAGSASRQYHKVYYFQICYETFTRPNLRCTTKIILRHVSSEFAELVLEELKIRHEITRFRR